MLVALGGLVLVMLGITPSYALLESAASASNEVAVGELGASFSVPSPTADLYPGTWDAWSIAIQDTASVGAGSLTLEMTVPSSALEGTSGLLWWAFACPGGTISTSGTGTAEAFACSTTWAPIGSPAPSCFGTAMTPQGCLGGTSGWMADANQEPWESTDPPQTAGAAASLGVSQVTTPPAGTNSGIPVLIPSGGSLPVLLVELLAPNSPDAAQGTKTSSTWSLTLDQRSGALRGS